MRKRVWMISLICLLFAGCIVYVPREGGPYSRRPPTTPDDRRYGSNYDESYFYEYLAPHGTWVRLSPHGHVWVPRHMGYRWHPYSDGRWIWTDFGWTWISEYDWGWVPFHYGRWGWDDDIGWFWVPGMDWAPAWVSWRTSGMYMGWAPLPPGVEYEYRYGIRRLSVEIPGHFWVFVDGRDFMERRLLDRIIPFERNSTILRTTVMKTNLYSRNNGIFNDGPEVNTVRRITRQQVERHVLRDARQAGPDRVGSGEVQIYRPSVRKNESAKPKETLDSDEARKRLGEVKIYEPRAKIQETGEAEREFVRKRHVDERKIVERTQTEEVKDLEKRFADREGRVRNAPEREKIRKEQETEIGELKKKHEQEKQALTERQKKDEVEVSKRVIKKSP